MMDNEENKINCGVCGYPSKVNSRFCANCGSKFNIGEARQGENVQTEKQISNYNENDIFANTVRNYRQPSAPVVYAPLPLQVEAMPPPMPYMSAPAVEVKSRKKVFPIVLIITIIVVLVAAMAVRIVLIPKKSPVEKILSAAEKTYGIEKCNYRMSYNDGSGSITANGAAVIKRKDNEIYSLATSNAYDTLAIYKDRYISGNYGCYTDRGNFLDGVDLSKDGIDGFKVFYEKKIQDKTNMDFEEFKDANKDLIKEIAADKEDNYIISDFETARVKGGEEYTFKVNVIELMHEISDIYGTEDADYSDYYDKVNADCDITIVNGYITGLSIKLSCIIKDGGSDTIRIRLQLNDINSDSVKVDMDKLSDISNKAVLYRRDDYDFGDDYDYSDDFYNQFGYGDSNDGNSSEDTDGEAGVGAA